MYLTHKTASINPVDIAAQIRDQIPELDVITTISTKYYTRIEEINQILALAEDTAIQNILIVSGAKKGPVDSVMVLRQANRTKLNLCCVYNPYLSDEQLNTEQQRLQNKMSNPSLSGVFLQIGTDTARLENGIQYIRTIQPAAHIGTSLLFPTRECLEHLKQRPWGDVQFENRYLNDLSYALTKTGAIYRAALQLRLEMLIQLLPLNEKNLEEFLIWKNGQNLYN